MVKYAKVPLQCTAFLWPVPLRERAPKLYYKRTCAHPATHEDGDTHGSFSRSHTHLYVIISLKVETRTNFDVMLLLLWVGAADVDAAGVLPKSFIGKRIALMHARC